MDDDGLASFTSITGTTPDRAQQYLTLTDGNLEQAIELFYANDGADLGGAISPTSAQQPSQAPSQQDLSDRSSGRRQRSEDTGEIVRVDSSSDIDVSDDELQITGARPRRQPANGAQVSSTRRPATSTPPIGGYETVDEDEAMARRLQEEYYGSAGTGGDVDAEGIRAPIARTTETLVGPESFDVNDEAQMRAAVLEQMRARHQPRPRGEYLLFGYCSLLIFALDRPGIFNQNVNESIWNEAGNNEASNRSRPARATAGASESSSRSNMLAEMYRPPFEIISRLPWDHARQEGKEGEKWLLVNIQDPSIFDCQVLNRDIWKNVEILDTVKENFIFMQYSKEDPRGSQYIQYYFQGRDSADAYPHIAIVDPRTGEQVKVWSGLPAPKAPEFLMQLHEFLDRYSLKASAKNPVARRKPDSKKETQIDKMTEEQMLEMAMQNSLAPAAAARRDSDPDELTRSLGPFDSSKAKSAEEDTHMATIETVHTNRSETSPFASISAANPHSEPPANTPSTRIQFRHQNGRIVRRFLLSDPVRRIYEWLKASPLEGKEGIEFELICMGKNLMEHLDETIEQVGLKNSSVMVEYLES